MASNEKGSKILSLVVSAEDIARKVRSLARKISKDYTDKPLVLVATLKGSFIFAADLMRELTCQAHIDFISVSSYEGTTPVDKVKYHYGPLHDVGGKNVIIVEDIIDTGATIKCVTEMLLKMGASDVKVCALLKRKSDREEILHPDYLGFTIEEGFVVGYGLDHNEDYRNLNGIFRI